MREVIEVDTLRVFDWVKSIIPAETFPVLQKLEHSVYWRFYHGITLAIKTAALEIRDLLADNSEYNIYRNLIGYESIFADWEVSIGEQRDFAKVEENRKAASQDYLKSITEQTWSTWRERILKFSETRSNDLATFPLFHDFLFRLAVKHPSHALELVRDYADKIELFKIPLFRGLWKTPLRSEFKPLAIQFAKNGEDLTALTKMFISDDELDTDILAAVLESAIKAEDEFTLAQLLVVAGTNFENDPAFTVDHLFAPAITALNALGSTNWIQKIWYQREMRTLISKLDTETLALVLTAIERTKTVSYQVEEFLKDIAEANPEAVIDLFGRRIEASEGTSSVDAIPYSFHGLKDALSEHPDMIVEKVKAWWQHDTSLFQFCGGRLIAITFPKLGEGLEAALMRLAASGDRLDAKFVIGVLRNYHGELFTHALCRQLVLNHHEDEGLMADVYMSLNATGVVMGEFGMAEAYSRKAEELKYWLTDDEAAVREFALQYIDQLRRQEAIERLRAKESIELRKHQYGVKDQNQE